MARQLGGNIDPAHGNSIVTDEAGDLFVASSNISVSPSDTSTTITINEISAQGVWIGGGALGEPGIAYASLAPLDSWYFLVNSDGAGDIVDSAGTIDGSHNDGPNVDVIGRLSNQTVTLYAVAWTSFSNNIPTVRVALLNQNGTVENANVLTAANGANPSVAQDGNGFIVTWDDTSGTLGDPDGGIAAQTFTSSGQATSAPFLVNTQTSGLQAGSDVVAGVNIVTWRDAQTNEIDAQILNGSAKVGSAFRVDQPGQGTVTGTTKIAVLGNGDYVVAWNDTDAFGNLTTHAQTIHGNGTLVGSEVTIADSGALGGISSVGADRFLMSFGNTAGIFSESEDASHSELIQNQATGQLDVLSLAGPTLTQSSAAANLWSVVGEGDFNGDGQMDLATQNNGQIDLVYLSGPKIIGSNLLSGSYWNVVGSTYLTPGNNIFPAASGYGLVTQSTDGQIDLLHFQNGALDRSMLLNGNYNHVVGAGNFYGDGKIEIATQDSAGQIDLLTFNGSNLTSSALVPGDYWTVKGVADVNHDGKSDFITQNSATGQIDYLMLTGNQVTGSLLEDTAYPGWNVVNASQTADQYIHGA